MKTHLRASRLLGVLLVAGLLATTAPASAALGSPTAQGAYRIKWQPCAENPRVQCGTIRVPLDWARPDGAKITVALARNPADDPKRRIGTFLSTLEGPALAAPRSRCSPTSSCPQS
jgi:uncharacterized lipoprotein YbaY